MQECSLAADAILDVLDRGSLRTLYDVHGPSAQAPLSRSVVAEVDGEVVGVTTAVEGLRHLERLLVVINVSERFRRRGIGSALLREVRRAAADPRQFKAQAVPGDPSSHGFLSHHGFTIVNRKWEGGFDPSDSSLLLRLQRLAAGSGHFDVMCASDRPAPEELRQAAEFFERWYRVDPRVGSGRSLDVGASTRALLRRRPRPRFARTAPTAVTISSTPPASWRRLSTKASSTSPTSAWSVSTPRRPLRLPRL